MKKTGLILFTLGMLFLISCKKIAFVEVDTRLNGRENAWTFSGRSTWKEINGVLYSPMYANPLLDRGEDMPALYADYALFDEHPEMRYRWEYAFPTVDFFTDIDVSITLQQYYAPGGGCGIVFRALDNVRGYTVEVFDMGRKGHDYRVSLMVNDESGYGTELAVGFAPHSVMPDEVIHAQFTDRKGWEKTSPEPATLRVKTAGPRITVFMDGTEVFSVEDDTYSYGATGIIAGVSAPIKITDYQLQARQALTTKERWQAVDYSGFVTYPVPRHRVGGWYGNPLLSRMPDGKIVITFTRTKDGPPATWRGKNESPAFTFSADEGKTWSEPKIICIREGYKIYGSVYGHKDGSWSFIGTMTKEKDEQQQAMYRHIHMQSTDNGNTWSEMEDLKFNGRLSHEYGWRGFYLYSVPFRISDGTVLMTGYRFELMPGAEIMNNDTRRDQSFVVRSTDDGKSWGAPILIDTDKFDTNECMVAEPEPGKLVSFSRTLRGRFMWTATSTDGGLTWSELKESSVSGECPNLLNHSSGAIVLASRDYLGNSVRITFDGGKSWTRKRRIPVSGMATMVELKDSRVFIAGHTGWSNPTWIQADKFRITPDGPVAER